MYHGGLVEQTDPITPLPTLHPLEQKRLPLLIGVWWAREQHARGEDEQLPTPEALFLAIAVVRLSQGG